MGLVYGRHIKELVLHKATWMTFPTTSKRKLEFALKCEKAIKCYAPGLIEEIQGISDSSKVNYESLITENFVSALGEDFSQEMTHRCCNVLAIRGEHAVGGNPIFGRNMDCTEEDLRHFHRLVTHPVGGLRNLGFGFGDIGRYGGINESGLAVASASIPFYKNKNQPGLRENIATRWILDNFSNSRDAVNYLEKIPHYHGISYLLADKSGKMARAECGPEAVTSTYLDDGVAIVGNFFQSEKMKHLDGIPSNDRAFRCYDNIKRWFMKHKGKISADTVKSLCSSHENGICEHALQGDLLIVTIWSWIAELGMNIVEVAEGNPCKNEYKSYRL